MYRLSQNGVDIQFEPVTAVWNASHDQAGLPTRREIRPDLIAANTEVFTFSHVLANVQVEEVVQRTGRLGHLIKVDLGDYAQADDFTSVDPAQVALDSQVNYFTNLGIPVASQKRTVSCQDDVYGGDCRAKRDYLFIGWNYTTLQKQRAATGAYIVRPQYKIRVGATTPASGTLDQIWGVIRGK